VHKTTTDQLIQDEKDQAIYKPIPEISCEYDTTARLTINKPLNNINKRRTRQTQKILLNFPQRSISRRHFTNTCTVQQLHNQRQPPTPAQALRCMRRVTKRIGTGLKAEQSLTATAALAATATGRRCAWLWRSLVRPELDAVCL